MMPVARERRPQRRCRRRGAPRVVRARSPRSSPSASSASTRSPTKVAFLFAEPEIDESAREKVLAKEGAGRALHGGGRGARGVRLDGRGHRGGAARRCPRRSDSSRRSSSRRSASRSPARRSRRRCSSRSSCSAGRRRSPGSRQHGRWLRSSVVGACRRPLDWGLTPPMGVRNIPSRAAPGRVGTGVWCNWQHVGFWFRRV